MTHAAHISAQMLREGRRTLAEIICSRLGFSDSNQGIQASSSLSIDSVEQGETQIQILAACLEFSSPALLDDYLRWISKLPNAVSPIQYDISSFLEELIRIVEIQFPRDVTKVVKDFIHKAVDSLRNEPPETMAISSVSHSHKSLQRDYLAFLLATRRGKALEIVMQAVGLGVDIESIYLHVIQPAQQELGRLWETGKISVAQEHYCTAATQFVMSQLQPYFISNHSSSRTLVATCVGDELHEVGLRIVADLFEVNGWNSVYLGANVPAESIVQSLVANRAQVLALSTTMTQHLFELADVISVVRDNPGCKNIKIVVGGYPFNVDPFLWKRVGADAHAIDAKTAIQIANQFAGSDASSENQALESRHQRSVPQNFEESSPSGFGETSDDLTRLNNSLITLQRKLTKANVELAALNKANQEKAESLEQAGRRKDEFLAMLAHELRGPLAPMELAVALLQMDDLQPSVVAEARETMKRQLHQMSHLISDLLDASRIAHGKIELKKETLDVTAVIHRAVETVHPLILDKAQDLTLDIPVEPTKLLGDEIRLAQIFANLLTNASKYTDREGSIWLTVRRVRDQVVIEIRDNGVGIEAGSLPNLFIAFTQEQRSSHHSMGGLGLGLSLVKQLVELHQGTVKAESEGAGRGSLFTVTLPSLEDQENVQSIEMNATQEAEMAQLSRRVLIVEDSAGIARMTAILFKKLGHLPEIALDGGTAIKKYKELQPEIVLLDLMLPDMSGLEVTQEIRRLDPHDATLIVVLTGHGDDEHRQLAKESGCDEYLVKPVDVRDLKELATHPKLMTPNGSQ
ncbi:ATP-binding protein [Thalassoglobus polymorphus]|uniref:histidine kinase n=1 Tax=Thalassoglobus polymorphus TaxID=2527994 RepID=A0A517QNT1_9PLAN|nr:ATP-binding protein [Thalassoglobus polymorphus]QDT33264.1 Autoinducer 2 sensor kinase/phosphatase LuxQ [Thalassoglobus polymorphus]